jgi:hypothetical protein
MEPVGFFLIIGLRSPLLVALRLFFPNGDDRRCRRGFGEGCQAIQCETSTQFRRGL